MEDELWHEGTLRQHEIDLYEHGWESPEREKDSKYIEARSRFKKKEKKKKNIGTALYCREIAALKCVINHWLVGNY